MEDVIKILQDQDLNQFNDTYKKFRDDVTINELFEEQVLLRSDEAAVICDHGKSFNGRSFLTYRELNDLSSKVALRLRENGVRADSVVGICVERSFAMIIGIMGILKAGGAYLPLSPDLPGERISYMLSDSSVEVLLVQDKTLDRISFDGIIMNLEDPDLYLESAENLNLIHKPENLVYVIYTSGSTGRPKGVMIEHRSLVNRLSWMQNKFPLDEGDLILHKTPYYFDVSVWEIFWWAVTGSKMYLLSPGAEKFPLMILDAIKKHKITTVHFVPSLLNLFLEYLEGKDQSVIKQLSSLRRIFSSGEALTVSHVRKFNNILGNQTASPLINLYGPTEATVDVSCFECPSVNNIDVIPIGKPIDNTKLFIIKDGSLASTRESGELYISGIGLARGYINNPELTEEKFIDNPFLPGEKMYKTGDIARRLPDGNIEYLGREDYQVKISGLRIELGEIESTLREYPGISDCIVTVKQYSENIKLIIAYVVPKSIFNPEELKKHLKRYLPDYMIPNQFVQLEEIPLLPNGKADRKALPEPILNNAKRIYSRTISESVN